MFALKWDTVRSFAGLAAPFVISIVVMDLSYDLIRTGHETAGTILAAVDLAGLVAVFIYGTHVVREERERKAETMPGPGERGKREDPKELPPGSAEQIPFG